MSQLQDLRACTFLVELQLNRPSPTRGSDSSTWEVKVFLLHLFTFPSVIVLTVFSFSFSSNVLQVVGALPYLDRELSPSTYRSFFIPYLWQEKNVFGMYKLLKRVSKLFSAIF
jgi:alpha-1,2-mannosyltransferase